MDFCVNQEIIPLKDFTFTSSICLALAFVISGIWKTTHSRYIQQFW